MTTPFKRIVALLLAITLLSVALGGCATANGFGKDMEGAGKDIQHETK